MFQRILVPLDGSSLAEAAIPHAAAVALSFESSLSLIRVIPVRRRGGSAPMDIIDRRLGHAEAHAYLDTLAGTLRGHGLTVDTEVGEGQPAEQILEVVRRRRADLITLTSHGAGGCSEFPLSGTAHKVIARAGVSVLIVPILEGVAAEPAWAARYRRILVAVDGSHRGNWAVGPAATLARRAGAELVLAHVVQFPSMVEAPPSADVRRAAERFVELNRRAASLHMAETKSRIEGPDLDVRTRIEVSAHVPETLAELAEAESADLVALTAHGASMSTRPYGAIAAQVLADIRRPVLIAQDAPRGLERGEPAGARERETALNHR